MSLSPREELDYKNIGRLWNRRPHAKVIAACGFTGMNSQEGLYMNRAGGSGWWVMMEFKVSPYINKSYSWSH